MNRFLSWLLVALLTLPTIGLAADAKITALTATTTPASTDIVPIVIDPSGTPLNRKVTVGNLAKGMGVVGVVTVTQPATAATLTILDNKTFIVNKTLTLDGTDSTTHTFPSTSSSVARTDAAQSFTGVQTFGSQIIVPQGAAATPSLKFANGTNTGFYSNNTNQVSLALNGTQRYQFTNGTLFIDSVSFDLANGDTLVFRKGANILGVGSAVGTTDGFFQGKYKSSNGTSGATTTCTIVGLTSITVIDGLITSCS